MAERKRYRWGIIGAGAIVRRFTKGLSALEDVCIYGVAGRRREPAERFAEELRSRGADEVRLFDTAEALVSDPAVDVVYIGAPNDAHAPLCRLALEHGKHVLCEKPFALNERQTRELTELAEKKGLFLMEAMWSRYLPAIRRAKEIAESGGIGKISHIRASFGWHNPSVNAAQRLFDPKQGGGALLDVGVYPINFALNFMGRFPDEIRAYASVGATGVDETNDIEFLYHEDGGRDVLCQISSSTRCDIGTEGCISGEYGELRFPVHWAPDHFFWKHPKPEIPDAAERIYALLPDGTPNAKPLLTEEDFVTERVDCPFIENGFEYEAMEVMSCLRGGRTESPLHPMEETARIMAMLDGMRRVWGVTYPED
ncbi:Gfo/Idh/MocA family protein [Lachnoclostridium sp. Marseille-P6806]|uniref:Gfo/Idh/MocA family protein n=1 Tax=Lachnoclostridium sp. Marseille-P6806 TaxID=2364793 RepID=UPI0013EF22B9|nr:Gfo/Idh/MocA family oxidoreductase [Lachnoclostridium sp. Marseille-P6806]